MRSSSSCLAHLDCFAFFLQNDPDLGSGSFSLRTSSGLCLGSRFGREGLPAAQGPQALGGEE